MAPSLPKGVLLYDALARPRRRRCFEPVLLGAILALAFLIRFLFVAYFSGLHGGLANDAVEYDLLARSLLRGEGFAFGPGRPTAFRPFGYPMFIAAVYRLFGDQPLFVGYVQALADSLMILFAYLLARDLLSRFVAVLAGLFLLVHPVLIYGTGMLAPETITLFLLVIAALSAQKALQGGGWLPVLTLTASLALAGLCRPDALILPPLLAAGACWAKGRRVGGRVLLACASSLLLVVVPVAVRNYLVFGEFIPAPTIGGVTFWGSNNPLARGGWIMPTAENWAGPDVPDSMRGWGYLTEKESQSRYYATALSWIRDHPAGWARLLLQKLGRSLTFSFADEQRANQFSLFALVYLLWMVLALAGALAHVRQARRLLVLYLLLISWLVKTLIFYGSARQAMLAAPALAIFAALALAALFRQAGSRPAAGS